MAIPWWAPPFGCAMAFLRRRPSHQMFDSASLMHGAAWCQQRFHRRPSRDLNCQEQCGGRCQPECLESNAGARVPWYTRIFSPVAWNTAAVSTSPVNSREKVNVPSQ